MFKEKKHNPSVKYFTVPLDNIMVDDFNKPLYFLNSDQLNVSNLISPDDLGFFYKYYGDFFHENCLL